MTNAGEDILGEFEVHDVEAIRSILDAGLDIHAPIKGLSVVNSLLQMYTRSDRFPACLHLLLERGAVLDDPLLAPVLLDDPVTLTAALDANPALIDHRTNMISTFTPLLGASLLHVAAEYGNRRAAEVLIAAGADVNARAASDALGYDGQTPLFHTVNSNANRSEPIMRLLLDAGARADIRLPGLAWGRGFEWQTTFFDVTPISYAQLGLMPQVHRKELDIYANVTRLLAAAGRAIPPLPNIPNKYLLPRPTTP